MLHPLHLLTPTTWLLQAFEFYFTVIDVLIFFLSFFFFLLVVLSFKASKNFFAVNNSIAKAMCIGAQKSIIEND